MAVHEFEKRTTPIACLSIAVLRPTRQIQRTGSYGRILARDAQKLFLCLVVVLCVEVSTPDLVTNARGRVGRRAAGVEINIQTRDGSLEIAERQVRTTNAKVMLRMESADSAQQARGRECSIGVWPHIDSRCEGLGSTRHVSQL